MDMKDGSIENFHVSEPGSQKIFVEQDIAFERDFALVSNAKELVGQMNVENTILPIATLIIYKYIKSLDGVNKEARVTMEMLPQELIERINHLSKEEKNSSDPEHILPTIGIELEFPRHLITEEEHSLLEEIGINNTVEPSHTEWWEVRTRPTYTAEAQARYLQELANTHDQDVLLRKMDEGAQEIGLNEELLRSYSGRIPTSLHVNFGVPQWVDQATEGGYFEDDSNFRILCAGIVVAYVSDERLRTKKTTSIANTKYDTVIETNKTPQQAEGSIAENGQAFLEGGHFTKRLRIEFTSSEFSGNETYRMLEEMQTLVAGYFCTIPNKKDPSEDINDRDIVAVIYTEFLAEMESCLGNYSLSYGNILSFPSQLLEVRSAYPYVVKEVRQIITRYATKIRNIINPKG